MPASSDPARLAAGLAALGWHILPLSPASKRPPRQLWRLPAAARHPRPLRRARPACPRAGGATASAPPPPTPPSPPGGGASPRGARRRRRALRPGPGRHRRPRRPAPTHLATGLLPGIDLATEPIPPGAWDDPARFRDGRDTLALLARLRGGPRPWPPGPDTSPSPPHALRRGAPVVPGTRRNLRQALSDPHGRYGLGWQIDLKAGWSYGIAPGATTTAGTYRLRGGDPAHPGRMPAWLAREVIRATTTAPRQPATAPPLPSPGGPGPAAYLATVIGRGATQLAALTDGRKRALSALAYHAGGLLAWSGAVHGHSR